VADALDIALELKHAAYDCLYLAAALAERCVLVTADATFATKAAEQVRFAGTVRLL
jgi:predicted nucleic acid-binding protein